MNPIILSVGEVLWDVFPTGPRFGGAAANLACHASAAGAETAILTAVGADSLGREAVTTLRAHGVDVSLVQEIPSAPTGMVQVTLDLEGKPTFEIHCGSAWDQIAWTELLSKRVLKSNAICFGTLCQRCPASRSTIQRTLGLAREFGVRRVLDVNLRKPFYDEELIRNSVNLASVVKLSDDELTEVLSACDVPQGESIEASLQAMLQRYQLELIAFTRGAKGALLVSGDEVVDQPGIPTKVCDTVGAGDAFTAVLVTGLANGLSLAAIARRACEAACEVCAQPGAVPDLRRGS
jgi:fructokinase